MRKKIFHKFFIILIIIFAACSGDSDENDNQGNNDNNNQNSGNNNGNNNGNDDNGNSNIKTGRVTFFNESNYSVVVHQNAFSGPVLLELSSWESKRVDVRVSDNYGVGSTFSIEYLYRVNEDSFDADSGEIFASGIDPNVQINFNIEENKSYTVQIPHPQNIEFRSAFIKIINASNLQCELRYLGTVFKQTNGTIPVAPDKTGVFKLEGIPPAGKLYQNYVLVSTFESTIIPDFTAENGYIYTFTYNGSSVIKTGEQIFY